MVGERREPAKDAGVCGQDDHGEEHAPLPVGDTEGEGLGERSTDDCAPESRNGGRWLDLSLPEEPADHDASEDAAGDWNAEAHKAGDKQRPRGELRVCELPESREDERRESSERRHLRGKN